MQSRLEETLLHAAGLLERYSVYRLSDTKVCNCCGSVEPHSAHSGWGGHFPEPSHDPECKVTIMVKGLRLMAEHARKARETYARLHDDPPVNQALDVLERLLQGYS